MRILVTAKPKMYREALALALHRHRPDFEVMLVSAESLDGEIGSFRPHLLLRNDNDRAGHHRWSRTSNAGVDRHGAPWCVPPGKEKTRG